MAYRTIFWGNSSYSINIFRLQIIRIIMGTRIRYSSREIFKKCYLFIH